MPVTPSPFGARIKAVGVSPIRYHSNKVNMALQRAAVYAKSMALISSRILANIAAEQEYPVVQERPIPKAVDDKLLVKIEAVGLNPIDCADNPQIILMNREDDRFRPFRRSSDDFGARCCGYR